MRLCLFSVCNVAINRPSYQSSVYSEDASLGPYRGNDGKKSNMNWKQCVHSDSNANPWWAVDLGVPLSVEEVFFTNRDGFGKFFAFSSRCDVIRVLYVLVKQVRCTNLYLSRECYNMYHIYNTTYVYDTYIRRSSISHRPRRRLVYDA